MKIFEKCISAALAVIFISSSIVFFPARSYALAPQGITKEDTQDALSVQAVVQKMLKTASLKEHLSEDSPDYKTMVALATVAVESAYELKEFLSDKKKMTVQEKADKSLVTEADTHLNEYIKQKLLGLNIPFIGEESKNAVEVINGGTYIAVDPIDGTSNFLAMFNGELEKPALDNVTLIALVEKGKPTIGICFNHYTGELDVALHKGNEKFQSHIAIGGLTGLAFPGKPGKQRVEALQKDKALILGSKAKDRVNAKYNAEYPVAKIGGLGFRIISLCNDNLTSGVVYHKSQQAGLWDLAAPSVFASLRGVMIYDGEGNPLDFTKAAFFPGNGAIALKGDALGYAVAPIEIAEGDRNAIRKLNEHLWTAWERLIPEKKKENIPKAEPRGMFSVIADPGAKMDMPASPDIMPVRPVREPDFNFNKIKDRLTHGGRIFARVNAYGNAYFMFPNDNPAVQDHSLMVSETVRPNALTKNDLKTALMLAQDNPGLRFLQNTCTYTVNHLHIHVVPGALPFEKAAKELRSEADGVQLLQSSSWPLANITFKGDDADKLSSRAEALLQILQKEQVPHWTCISKGEITIFAGKLDNPPVPAVGAVLGEHHHLHILEAAGLVGVVPEKAEGLTQEQITSAFRAASASPEYFEKALRTAGMTVAAPVTTTAAAPAQTEWLALDQLDGKISVNTKTGEIRYSGPGPVVQADFDLYVARHGETKGNHLKILQGVCDVEGLNQLNELGKKQAIQGAEEIYAQIKDKIAKGEEIVLVISPQKRAQETAQAFIDLVKERTGKELKPVIEKDAREISFGVFGNRPYEGPSEEVKRELEKYGIDTTPITPAENEIRLKFLGGDALAKFDQGENFVDMLIRSKKLLEDMNEKYKGKTVVLVGHGTQLVAARVLLRKDPVLGKDAEGNETIIWRKCELKNAECRQLAVRTAPAVPAALREMGVLGITKDFVRKYGGEDKKLSPEDKFAFESLLFAEGLAAEAGAIMKKYRANLKELKQELKDDKTIVTKADQEVQDVLIKSILAKYPTHKFIAEEKELDPKIKATAADEYVWVIDPIDGTGQFVKDGATRFGVLITLLKKNPQGLHEPVMGMFYAPIHSVDGTNEGTIIEAVQGIDGAFLNGKKVSVYEGTDFDKRIGAIRKSSTYERMPFQDLLKSSFGKVLEDTKCTGLEFAETAASGNFDLQIATVHIQPKIWDIAAPLYLVEKAGGIVTDFSGKRFFPVDLNKINKDKPRGPCLVAASVPANEKILGMIASTGFEENQVRKIAKNMNAPGLDVPKGLTEKSLQESLERGVLTKQIGAPYGTAWLNLDGELERQENLGRNDAMDFLSQALRTEKQRTGMFLAKMEAVEKALETVTTDLPAGVTREQLMDALRNAELFFINDVTIGNDVFAHTGKTYGNRVYLGAGMVLYADAEDIARLLLEEAKHIVLDDPEHKLIRHDEALRQRLLTVAMNHGKRSEAIADGMHAATRRQADALEAAAATLKKEPVNVDKPAVIFLAVDPDFMVNLDREMAKRQGKGNFKVIPVYQKGFMRAFDYLNKAAEKYSGVMLQPVALDELKVAEGAPCDAALAAYANEVLGAKPEDIGLINSGDKKFGLAVSSAPEILVMTPAKAGELEVHNVGILLDLMEIGILARRMAGAGYRDLSFADLAKSLGPEIGKEFLAAVTALGIEDPAKKVAEVVSTPMPVKDISGTLKDQIESLKLTITAA